jgi:hypothetical protein
MSPTFAGSLDALSGWRSSLVERIDDLSEYLNHHELVEPPIATLIELLRARLCSDKLVVAFVAEFSRGKSELINAIFFADAGRRVLPAAPGRTTMCPVELAWDVARGPTLSLVPIETRLEGLSLAELRVQERSWRHMTLHVDDADQLAQSLQEVTRTEWMSKDRARELGFWDDKLPEDNPPLDDHGRVQVPAWRHALINYPHPLLKQGLVVLDTPGLNAIGAEPELTLSLLPSAHATVFVLGADTGVTKSDLAIWRDHLNAQTQSRFVVLNKIDTLRDNLLHPEQVQAQIGAQRRDCARILDVPIDKVFPLSARQALAARVSGDEPGLRDSRLPELEAALGEQLLPQRRAVLEDMVLGAAQQVEFHIARRLGDGRRQLAEQLLELRGLRGKSSAKLALMLQRVDAETAEFEQCTARLLAMRAVHSRILKDLLVGLSTSRLHEEVSQMEASLSASFMNLGARKAFVSLCQRLRSLLVSARERSAETREMLATSFGRLNAEFGFSLALADGPDLERFERELSLIERNYVQYLGPTQALRLASPKFMEQFKRMLVSRLRVVFENASGEVELWNKAASAQVDLQLRDRRRSFKHRHDSLERIEIAAGELEQRIRELESQDQRTQLLLAGATELTEALREQTCAAPMFPLDSLMSLDLEIDLVGEAELPRLRQA